MWSTLVSLAILMGNPVTATLFQSMNELTKDEYDYIIVGGGVAGSVLANRLSEDPEKTVLVVEAGVDNANIPEIIVPFFGPQALHTKLDWNYTTTPQAGLLGRVIDAPRGHVLGGSSSISKWTIGFVDDSGDTGDKVVSNCQFSFVLTKELHYMTWNRGSDDVWDNFASLTGDPGWSWESVEQYNFKSSSLVPSADHHDTTGQVIPSAHGNGPVLTSVYGFPSELDPLVSGTATSLGQYNEDHNAGSTIGYGFIQSSIGNGERSSAATAYLVPALGRPNLDVVVNTRAIKLFASCEPQDGQQLTIDTLQIAQDAESTPRNITATGEIILSAGTFGTPQLLLLSGIGPEAELNTHNIPVVLDSPDVGQHLTDHPLLANYYVVNSDSTIDPILRDPATFIPPLLEEWETSRTGLLTTSGGGNTIAFLKNPSDEFPVDPSSGPGSGNIEMIFGTGFQPLGTIPLPESGSYMTVITAVVSPTSRGTLTLNSANPFDNPAIDLGLYSTEYDIKSMVHAMKAVEEFTSQPLWADYIIQPYIDLPTDADKENYARSNSLTVFHPVGTARMGPEGVEGGVVAPSLKVKGVNGLRIVDASVFPQIPEVHPQALVYILAERAADLIKGTI